MAAPNAGRGDRAPLPAVVRLLVRMAMEDPSWGYTRLRGALKNIGHELGRSTIKRTSKAKCQTQVEMAGIQQSRNVRLGSLDQAGRYP